MVATNNPYTTPGLSCLYINNAQKRPIIHTWSNHNITSYVDNLEMHTSNARKVDYTPMLYRL
jgi:hypothetical protein